ncbi:Crp/Fnr family transcriptional regulator [Sulfurimonas sp. HSL-1716]|uniref:Crp/Fnr family transcriptional regulator n=1 Tax=Hydrocurvibacter sulfurireducens TaxID=3131937 RepID=UPI0031F7DE70
MSVIHQYPKGYVLYYEDDISNKIFFLVEGLLRTYKVDRYENEIFLSYVYKNKLISEISSLSNNDIHCYANTEFVEDSIVLEVDYEQFKEHFIYTSLLTDKFIEEILRQTHELHCIINRELIFDATARVTYMLYEDLQTFNKLKRQDVSAMLHIQPETLSRILHKLKRQKVIDLQKTDVVIVNRTELRNIFTGNDQ